MFNAFQLDDDRAAYEQLIARNQVYKPKPMQKANPGGIVDLDNMLDTAKHELINGLLEYAFSELHMRPEDF